MVSNKSIYNETNKFLILITIVMRVLWSLVASQKNANTSIQGRLKCKILCCSRSSMTGLQFCFWRIQWTIIPSMDYLVEDYSE